MDGSEVVTDTVNRLRGGVAKDSAGNIVYLKEHRLMNDYGVASVEFFLKASVNKISHLTNYRNEERLLAQLREKAKAFLKELTLNMKVWAPSASFKELIEIAIVEGEEVEYTRRVLVNPQCDKVRNKYLVLQVVENALLDSMQRGAEGFEANITGKNYNVQENIGEDREKRQLIRPSTWGNKGDGYD